MAYSFKEFLPFYKRNLKVAVPVMLTQLGGGVAQLADTAMVGHVSAQALAAVAFANSIFIIGMVFAMGTTFGITPLIGQAFVQEKHEKVRDFLKSGFLFTFLIGAVVFLVMSALVPFLENMGQEKAVIEIARNYYITLIFSLPPFLVFCWLKQFLEGLGNTKIAMIITIIANVLNIVLNYFLIFGKFGFPALGALGAGVATLISRLIMPLLFLIFIKRNKNWWRYFSQFFTKIFDKNSLKEVSRVGFPIGCQLLVECSAFCLVSIMVGWLGAVALAGHQIALNTWNLAFMGVIGISSATTIRISHQFGLRDFYALKMAGKASVHLCLLFNAFVAVIFIAFCWEIPRFFTTETAVVETAAPLLVLAGLFQFSDGMQSIGSSLLRGLTDVRTPMIFAAIAYLLVSLPLGYVLAFTFSWGAKGMWIAYIFGLSLAAVLFLVRYRKLVRKLEKENL